MADQLDELVEVFATSVVKQNLAKNSDTANRHARTRVNAFEQLVSLAGDKGRERLASLFLHSDPGVRCMAAVYLLRYKHEESMEVLEELARGRGLVAFGAKQTIKNWHSGDWEIDPGP